MRVKSTSPVSSYSSLFRQHLPQPSQSASHSAGVIWSSGTVFQNWSRIESRSCLHAIGGHLVDQGGQSVECQLGPQEIDKRHRQRLSVKITVEIQQIGFKVGRIDPEHRAHPSDAAPL